VGVSSYGKLTNPDAWRAGLPSQLFESLGKWIKGQPFDLTHRRWLTAGQSGSYVAAVRLQPGAGKLRGAILKLLPPQLGPLESRGAQLAHQLSPRPFVEAHLVNMEAAGTLPGADWWFNIQDVAHADLAAMLPLARLVDDLDLASYCAAIVESVTEEWNAESTDPEPESMDPSEYLAAQLEPRILDFRRFIDAAGLDAKRPPRELRLPGRHDSLPNPLAFLAGAWDDGTKVEIFANNGHGDLHPGNIMIPVESGVVRAEQFRLIDYGRFSNSIPVSRDPAKLLISVATFWLPGLSAYSSIRSSLAELLVEPADYPAAPPVAGYLAVARAIYTAAASWGVRRRHTDEWDRQYGLTIAAAALRSVARAEYDMADRWWFLEVAAVALARFRNDPDPAGRRVPTTPPTATRTAPTAAAATPSTEPAGDEPFPAIRNLSGSRKLEFCHRLGNSWPDLADVLGIRPHEVAQFRRGDEARDIWNWLEIRGRLPELRPALLTIGRPELARRLEEADHAR
jgi:hypothetical protein